MTIRYNAPSAALQGHGDTGDGEPCDHWVVDIACDQIVVGQASVYASRQDSGPLGRVVWPAAPSHEWLSQSLYQAVMQSVQADDPESLSMGRILELARGAIARQT